MSAAKPLEIGLFLGMSTVDFIHQVAHFPHDDEKIRSDRLQVQTGGPPTNAAKVFQSMGGQARLFTLVGNTALRAFMMQEFAAHHLEVIDLDADYPGDPPVASVISVPEQASRAILYTKPPRPSFHGHPSLKAWAGDGHIVLIDGRFWESALELITTAHQHQIPVVLDGGSWKPGMEQLLPLVDIAICGAAFRPPNQDDPHSVIPFLADHGIHAIAITHGADPVRYWQADQGEGDIVIPPVKAVDTLGAGDVFHGAFCRHYARHHHFVQALIFAAETASDYCTVFGITDWLKAQRPLP